MPSNKMEDQLRQRLSQYPTPIDIDALWGEVEPRLPKKKRRVLPFWFWLVASIALSGSLLLLFPGEDNAPPLTEAADVSPSPLKTEKTAPSPVVDVTRPAPKPPTVATDGTLTDVPIPKSAPALKTARTALPPKTKTKVATLKPSTPLMEREVPMIYTKAETSGPEVNTPIAPLNIDLSAKPEDLVIPRIPTPLVEKIPVSKPFAIIDPVPNDTPVELSKEPVEVKNSTRSVEEKGPTAKKEATTIVETEARPAAEAQRIAEEIAGKELLAEKEAAKVAKAEAAQERRAAEKIATRQAKELANQRRKAEKEIAKAAAAETKQTEEALLAAGEMVRQEKAAEEKAREQAETRAKRDAAIRRVDELSAAKLSRADQKTSEQLALLKARKEKKKQQALTKTELREQQIQAREQRKADKQQGQVAKTATKLAKKNLREKTIQDRALADARKRQQRTNEKNEADLAKAVAADLRKRGEATRRIAQRKGEQREANTWKANRTAEVESRKEAEKRRAIEKMEAERAKVLASQRQSNDGNEQLKVKAYARQKALEARLAARMARKAERDLAKGRKAKKEDPTGKIPDQNPAYWTLEPSIALSLPGASGGGGDGSGSEKALEGISLQALVGYHRAGGLSIRMGLTRSQINSKVEAETTRQGTQPVEAVIAIIENPNGSRSEQRGIVQVATTETITTKYYNSVSSTDIPLLIGYRFAGNKWGLMVEAGPTFNLNSGGEAHRFDGAGFTAVEDSYFRQKLEGQGFLVNFGGEYGLTKTTSLTANLRFQSFGNGGFENPDATSVSTNYSLLGIQLGYRIRF